ncbi:hypothetical protein [Prevotella sp. E13-27]|uniref:hypothetical protein n=1 Tax=Prevotella sp. E13-27 TaxID=2938122 RepID=UPI00200A11E0|nr:hypothetical protein [Prevotella sp. E13-27]MCK8622096.1 hypothetical protein [Prevotella sp. E13-27]
MKKLLKTFLLAVCLLVGGTNSTWADVITTHSWTFTGLATSTAITKSETTSLTQSGTTCNLATAPTCCAGLYFYDNWQVYRTSDSNPGLRNISNGDRMVIVPNLKKGDIITITGNSDAINNINTTPTTGTKDEVNNTLTFTMSADGNFYFKMVKNGATVNDVKVYPTIKSIVVTHNYAKAYEANFENADTYANGWTFSNITPSQGVNDTNKYLLLTQPKNGSASISFANNVAFLNADNYRFSFDFNMNYHVTGRAVTITITAIKNSNQITLFKIVSNNADGYGTTSHVQNSNSEDLTTFTNGGYGNSATMTPSNSFVINSSSSGTTLTVNSGDPITLSDGLVTIKEIKISTQNSSALKESFDNIILRVDVSTSKTRASNAITEYNSIKNSVMNSSTKIALDAAYSTLNTDFDTDEEIYADYSGYISAIEALETANEDAQTSINDFIILNDLITRANTFAETVTSYVAPEGASTVYTSNADVDPVALAADVRAEVIEEGVKNDNTDITAIIANSSFELGSTLGWTTIASNDTGAKGNSSPYTTSGIDGSWQFNTWSQGTPITQTIGTLPAGQYKLAALVASDGGTIYLKMNNTHNSGVITTAEGGGTYVDNEYTFTLATETEVTIGAVGSNDDGSYTDDGHWWYKADKFTLTYVGQDPLALAKVSLEAEIVTATALYNSWTPKVGTAPFKYDATYYNALNIAIGEAQDVIDADGDEVDDYTDAKSALETAEGNMASSTQNQPDPDKYYQIFVANNDGTASDFNLYMLYEKTKTQVKVSATPYPIKITVDKDNSSYYNIQTPYGNDLCTDKDAKTTAYVKTEGINTRCNQIKFTLNDDGTIKIGGNAGSGNFNNYQAAASEGSLVTAPQGGSGKWVISDAVDVTDVNLAVNATTGWGTFIAPYENLIPSTVKAYTVSHKGSGYIYLEENETGVLNANTPYILSTEEASNVSVALKGIANNDKDTYEDNGLVGLLAAKTVPADSYILQYQADKVGTAFYKLENSLTGTKYRCYLDLDNVPTSSSSRASVRMSIFDDETTGIENLTPALSEGEGVVYNLRGQRVAKPTKGLYIVNGQKVVVK